MGKIQDIYKLAIEIDNLFAYPVNCDKLLVNKQVLNVKPLKSVIDESEKKIIEQGGEKVLIEKCFYLLTSIFARASDATFCDTCITSKSIDINPEALEKKIKTLYAIASRGTVLIKQETLLKKIANLNEIDAKIQEISTKIQNLKNALCKYTSADVAPPPSPPPATPPTPIAAPAIGRLVKQLFSDTSFKIASIIDESLIKQDFVGISEREEGSAGNLVGRGFRVLGGIKFKKDGNIKMRVTVCEKFRVYIDDKELISEWKDITAITEQTQFTKEFTLENVKTSNMYNLRFESIEKKVHPFFHYRFKIEWQIDNRWEIIPSENLYPIFTNISNFI